MIFWVGGFSSAFWPFSGLRSFCILPMYFWVAQLYFFL